MKYLILAFCLCFLMNEGFSQDSALIVGNWKVVSVFTGEIYVSALNDSTYISPELKGQYSETELKELEKKVRIQFLGMSHSFSQQGIHKINFAPGMELESRFKLDNLNKVLKETSTNSLGHDVTEETVYSLNNDTLNLTIKLEDTPLAITLKRVK